MRGTAGRRPTPRPRTFARYSGVRAWPECRTPVRSVRPGPAAGATSAAVSRRLRARMRHRLAVPTTPRPCRLRPVRAPAGRALSAGRLAAPEPSRSGRRRLRWSAASRSRRRRPTAAPAATPVPAPDIQGTEPSASVRGRPYREAMRDLVSRKYHLTIPATEPLRLTRKAYRERDCDGNNLTPCTRRWQQKPVRGSA